MLAVRAALDEQTFSEATAVGSHMSIEELIAFVTLALDRRVPFWVILHARRCADCR